MQLNKLAASLAVVGMTVPVLAFATNGMLMDGYGPIAAGMGGAAMAYDNGTAALANNPATLGLMAPGSRIDVMAGFCRSGRVGPRHVWQVQRGCVLHAGFRLREKAGQSGLRCRPLWPGRHGHRVRQWRHGAGGRGPADFPARLLRE